jgi:hypothetical protein
MSQPGFVINFPMWERSGQPSPGVLTFDVMVGEHEP